MPALLAAIDITKQFPGTLALDHVKLELQPGEIHAVMGENGAGKSTLMKILSGVYAADSGEIRFEDRPVSFATPNDALKLGINIVYQELSLVPALTIAENIYAGRLPATPFGIVKYAKLFQDTAGVLAKLNVTLDPRTRVETLSIANQQLVEIAKALSANCKVLILDEPTSALTDYETEKLMALLRQLAASGVGILYISHKLKEVFALADRITVLRDGKYVGTQKRSEATPDEIVRMMVGRELGNMYPPKNPESGAPLLEIRNFRLHHSSARNNFQLHKGEILGFAGLIGSGRTELARAIFGAESYEEGEVILHGCRVNINSPRQAIKLGIGYLPEDRKAAGLFLEMSLKLNLEAAVINQVSSLGFVSPPKERLLAERYIDRLNISSSGVEQEVSRLSGGNQQKTLVAKWHLITSNLCCS